MGAGAEDHAGVEEEGDALLRIVGPEPFGDDEKPLADGDGLVVRFPIVFPVLVAAQGGLDGEGAEVLVGKLFAQGAQGDGQLLRLPDRRGAVLQVEPDLGEALHALGERLVDVVPIGAVFSDEALKVLLIVDDKAVVAQRGEAGGDGFHAGGGGFDGQFEPIQFDSLLLACKYFGYDRV